MNSNWKCKTAEHFELWEEKGKQVERQNGKIWGKCKQTFDFEK
jgi:hypothetical protein